MTRLGILGATQNNQAWDGSNTKQSVSPRTNENTRIGSTPESVCVVTNMEQNLIFSCLGEFLGKQ